MLKKSQILLAILACLIITNTATAQQDIKLPFLNYIKLINLKELSDVKSWKVTGKIELNNGKTNDFEFYYLKPNFARLYVFDLQRTVYSVNGKEDFYKLGTGRSMPITPAMVAFLKYFSYSIANPICNFYSDSLNFKFVKNDSIGGVPVMKYDVFDKVGLSKELSISPANDLVKKVVFIDQIMEFSFPIDLYYNNYTTIGNVKYPNDIEIYLNEVRAIIKIDNITPNYELEEKDFKKPYAGY